MEALTQALSSSFSVSREPNTTSAPHPRLAQYKSKYSVLEQSERRRRFLELQKEWVIPNLRCFNVFSYDHSDPESERGGLEPWCSLLIWQMNSRSENLVVTDLNAFCRKRLNYVNHARRLADGDWTGADSEDEEEKEKKEKKSQQQLDKSADEDGMEIEERKKLPRHYANQVLIKYIARGWCFWCKHP